MITAKKNEIRAFCTTIDMGTPRTTKGYATILRSKYPMFWFDEEKIASVLNSLHAETFTLGNDNTYFYLSEESINELMNTRKSDTRYFIRKAELKRQNMENM